MMIQLASMPTSKPRIVPSRSRLPNTPSPGALDLDGPGDTGGWFRSVMPAMGRLPDRWRLAVAFYLEGHLDVGPKGADMVTLHHPGHIVHPDRPDVVEGLGALSNRALDRVIEALGRFSDHLDDFYDATHGSHPFSICRGRPPEGEAIRPTMEKMYLEP